MKNWTINEAVKVINEGTDLEAIKEIVSHFPVFAMAASKNDLAGVAVLMSDKFTLNRLAKEPIGVATDGNDGDVTVKKEAAEKVNKSLEEMTTKELMKLCDERGIKVPHYGKNKQFYLEKLQECDGGEPNVEEESGDWDEVKVQADLYKDKSAKELYTMCKERGIKAVVKKSAKFYADLLRKADEAEAEAGSEGDDDWGGEEEDVPAAKPKSKSITNGGNKPADDGDDWDI